MSCILLNTDGDIDFSTGRRVVVTALQTQVRQSVQALLNIWLAEWFLDSRVGTPWREYALIKNANVSIVNQMIATAVANVPGIASVTSVSTTFISTIRFAEVAIVATLDSGATLSGGTGVPYIVTLNQPGTA